MQFISTGINSLLRSSRPEVFWGKGVLKICSKFTGEHLLRNFIEITLWHGCSPVNSLLILRTIFTRNTSGWLLLLLKVHFTLKKQIWKFAGISSVLSFFPTSAAIVEGTFHFEKTNLKISCNFMFYRSLPLVLLINIKSKISWCSLKSVLFLKRVTKLGKVQIKN